MQHGSATASIIPAGRDVRAVRMAAGFSLAEAAAITGLAARTIESIEAGRQAPTQAMSRRLARLVAAVGLLD